jgi:class 3 adenylate cyclase
MFADMAGFTALMQQNERDAIRKRGRLKEVLDNCIPAFHGQIMEYAGDGH